MSAPIYISIYRPYEGNHFHWAIFINANNINTDTDTNNNTTTNQNTHFYEVTNEHPNFQFRHLVESPFPSTRHKEDILVGYVDTTDLTTIHSLLASMDIDNENSGWNCQDWVLEALEELCAQFYLDGEDDDYRDGVERAKELYFGPML